MNDPSLDAKAIADAVQQRLKKYEDLTVLEQFGMFMGTAQLLEAALKQLLVRRYKYDLERIERWTLGRTVRELEARGLRSDLIRLVESVVEYRNYIAHELLLNDAMLRSILGGDSGRIELRHLEKGIYELEQLVFLYDWCEAHNAW